MLLAVDVGNTNIVLGVLDHEKMVCSGRLSTNVNETEIEYSMKIKTFLEVNNVTNIDGAIISSVVPALVRTLLKSIKLVCAVDALVVGPGIKTGLNIKLDNPAEMGADIVVGDVAVINKYPLPAIVFDFGTATTASVIDKSGAHIGGAIMCGIKTAINSLSSGTAQLPQVDITAPSRVIGRNTIDAMKCGSVVGTAAMLEGLVARFEKELGEKATVVVTGALGKAIAKEANLDVIVDEDLLIDGLRIIYEKNKGN
ncbi:MAG: type III pantothenate kinase [Eubacterium sp.]|nr:type III pantothenate kinase [Eubacterium sp.]MDE6412625.1 type III pantothenate kinase [Eubacterium sp.]